MAIKTLRVFQEFTAEGFVPMPIAGNIDYGFTVANTFPATTPTTYQTDDSDLDVTVTEMTDFYVWIRSNGTAWNKNYTRNVRVYPDSPLINNVVMGIIIANANNGLPIGGTTGQILAKIDGDDYHAEWIDNYADWTSQLKHEVKAGVALTKGQAVYVSSADGTNMIVSKASNTTEPLSSKTLGLIAQNLAINAKGFVITEGLLSGLNTSSATAGDPVWLGVDGNLIYGLTNKPFAPAHLVFIGIVTRSNNSNGEIFVKVQNGFELQELHNVQITSVANKNTLIYDSATSLWKNVNLFGTQGYLPYYDNTLYLKDSPIFTDGTNVGIGTTSLGVSTVLTIAGSKNATSAIARGQLLNPTLIASANNDVLVGLDVNPTFTNGAFTGVSNLGLRVVGNVLMGQVPASLVAYSYVPLTLSNNAMAAVRTQLSLVNSGGSTGAGSAIDFFTYTDAGNGNPGLRIAGIDNGNFSNNFQIITKAQGLSGNGALSNKFQLFGSTGNVVIQNGGTFTDAGFKLDVTGTARITSNLTALSFIKSGGTSVQFLKADGSVTTLDATSPLAFNSTTGVFSMPKSTGIVDGYLSALDFDYFFNKVDGNGTINYLPKFSQTKVINDSQIIDNGVNVGIGTTNPLAKLSLAFTPSLGTAMLRMAGTTTINDSFTISNATANNNVFVPIFQYKATSYGYGGGTNLFTSGVYGGGFIANVDDVAYNTGNFAGAAMHFNARNYTNDGALLLRNLFSFGSYTSVYMTMSALGYLGIGTTIPAYKLDVDGDINISTGSVYRINGVAYSIASSSLNGFLSSTDWTTFNSKQSALTFGNLTEAISSVLTILGGTGAVIGSGASIQVKQASGSQSGFLSSTDWTTFNSKQDALVNPITGSLTANYIPKATGGTTLGNSLIFDNGTNVGIGTTSPTNKLSVVGTGNVTSTFTVGVLTGGNRTIALGIGGDITIKASAGGWVTGTFFQGSAGTGLGGFGAFGGTDALNYLYIGDGHTSNGIRVYPTTNAVLMSGNVGIGASVSTITSLSVNKNIVGGVSSFGVSQNGVVQSTVTTAAQGFYNQLNTQAATFTLSLYRHFFADNGTLGAGTTINNQYGFLTADLFQATNNFGFFGGVSAGANKWNLYMNGTANNYLAGSLGIGTTTVSNVTLVASKDITGSTTSIGIQQNGFVQSGVTSFAYGYFNALRTATATFNIGTYEHYYAVQSTIGVGSTITNQIGFHVASNLTGATNNYGFFSEIPSGTNRWNLYMSGTAVNYLAGNLSIGTTTTTYKLNWQSSTNFGFLDLATGGAVAGSTGFFEIWTGSSPSRKVRVQSTGNVSIGNTNDTHKLDVTGTINATTLRITGGASTQFLKADGTTDSTSYVPTIRTLTINGTAYDLSADRSWTIPTGVTGSGTINYIAKWNSPTNIGIGAIYDTGSSVGIGTLPTTAYIFNVQGVSTKYISFWAPTIGGNLENGIISHDGNGLSGLSPLQLTASALYLPATFINTTSVTGGGILQVGGDVNISGTFRVNGTAIGTGGGGVSGSGTTNTIPMWSGSTSLTNASIFSSGSGNLYINIQSNSSLSIDCFSPNTGQRTSLGTIGGLSTFATTRFVDNSTNYNGIGQGFMLETGKARGVIYGTVPNSSTQSFIHFLISNGNGASNWVNAMTIKLSTINIAIPSSTSGLVSGDLYKDANGFVKIV